ncbi:Uncharacterised protein [Shigella sonnei]|jgi:hypothetical protein|nr:Uncharacterised protein [Shigella sonnei]
MRLFQAGGINVHQGNMRRFQRLAMEHITKNIFNENRRTSADKCNFGCSHHADLLACLNNFIMAGESAENLRLPG